MATYYQSPVVTRKVPARADAGPCTVSMRAVFPVKANLAQNDIIEMLVLPADHVIVDAVVDADDLDSATSLDFDVGIMSGTPGLIDLNRTVGAQLFDGATTGQAAGVARATLRTAFVQMPANHDRSIGIKITTAPGTPVKSSTLGTNNRGFWQASTVYAVNDYIILPNGLRARVASGHNGTSGTTMPIEAFSSAVFTGTVSDGTVTWTIQDPYIALTVAYRSAFNLGW